MTNGRGMEARRASLTAMIRVKIHEIDPIAGTVGTPITDPAVAPIKI